MILILLEQLMTTKKKKEVKNDKMSVRKFFYLNKVFNKEFLIIALEKTYKSLKKTSEEWEDIMKVKNITF